MNGNCRWRGKRQVLDAVDCALHVIHNLYGRYNIISFYRLSCLAWVWLTAKVVDSFYDGEGLCKPLKRLFDEA